MDRLTFSGPFIPLQLGLLWYFLPPWHSESDVFAYECRRENDGGFTLHLTLHQPTQQPLDTLYTLRLDPGRQTVVTLIFLREAFGYQEPLFQPALLDEFLLQKLDAHRTK